MKKIANKAVLFFYIILALFRKQRNNAQKKILIIATLRLGDVIMSLPVFKAVKERYPDSEVSVMARAGFTEILEGNPYVDNIMPYYGKNTSNLKFVKNLMKERYDACINLCECKLNSAVYASGIPKRIGYLQKHRRRDRFFLTDPVQWYGEFKGITSMFLKLLEPMGIFRADDKPELYPQSEAIIAVANLLPQTEGLKVVVHPGGRNLTRRWPYYMELIEAINRKFNCLVIITGDNHEMPYIVRILEGVENKNIINLAGKTTLKQLTALCYMADIVIGNDTGVLHIARAVKTPTITIFGPEDHKITGTASDTNIKVFADVPCRTDSDYFGITMHGVRRCKKEVCEQHLCMKGITPDMVFGKIECLLQERRLQCFGD